MPAVAATSASRRGEAGRAGNDVRSDLHVIFEERASGGIEMVLRSRVELYYGDVIRQQVRDVLRTLGVEHALIEIVDEGALPFVIAARIEAAVRRAGLAPSKPARRTAASMRAAITNGSAPSSTISINACSTPSARSTSRTCCRITSP